MQVNFKLTDLFQENSEIVLVHHISLNQSKASIASTVEVERLPCFLREVVVHSGEQKGLNYARAHGD